MIIIKTKMYKILVVSQGHGGVPYYRSENPHIYLQNQYPDLFHIDIVESIDFSDLEPLKKYQLIHFHRSLGQHYEKFPGMLNQLKSLGMVTVMDLDDYWDIPIHHPMYGLVKHNRMDFYTKRNLTLVDYVTTTTPYFADKIRPFNRNVIYLHNACDPNDSQFKRKILKSDRIRIGYLGGSSHKEDIKILRGIPAQTHRLDNPVQWVFAGYDTRGVATFIDKATGEKKTKDMEVEDTASYFYEQIFTDNYRLVSDEYKDFLLKHEPQTNYKGAKNEKYRRIWTQPIAQYAEKYKHLDISLAPLTNVEFNRTKSPLKIMEAGFHKKAFIGQELPPYMEDIKHGENGFLVRDKRDRDWFKYLKILVNNPDMIKEFGEALYETVKKKYSLKHVSRKRKDFYVHIIDKHNKS